MRTGRYKYIRRFEERSSPVLPNVDDSPSKEVLLRGGWAERAPQPEQLYDLLFDPNESCNVIGQPQYWTVAADLRARLEAWMRSTHDPLLKGSVPAPVGALVNRADGISPEEPPERM